MLSMSIGLDHEATGLQNIKNLATMQMMSKREIERRLPAIIEFSELGAFIHMPFKTYSAGMMARLTFAVATQMDAEILLLDEWIGAGDAEFQIKAGERMSSLVDNAKMVVVATHDMNLVRRVCNKVMIMDGGRATFFGTIEDWTRQSAVA
jgi:lipopolysaccharide transport system ATP-binding protein